MAFRAALTAIPLLASAVLLSSSYRKEDFKETRTLEDELLEAALSDTEAPTEINEEDEMALKPVNVGRWFRRLGERIRQGFRRIEPDWLLILGCVDILLNISRVKTKSICINAETVKVEEK
ncbi:unnamed protein product [Dibothriocephalus latus]|uniref:Uncharacterized protein n=1 Tax=Dibothriocephalus latus TaxID=60516 RepID=A0A3P7R403_DIBLA|nr:unnamed protein product [Dibothriocephalus latus]